MLQGIMEVVVVEAGSDHYCIKTGCDMLAAEHLPGQAVSRCNCRYSCIGRDILQDVCPLNNNDKD